MNSNKENARNKEIIIEHSKINLFLITLIHGNFNSLWVRISETDHPIWMKIQIYFKMIFYDSVYHS